MTDKDLISFAMQAREMSYCPYSNFSVGAALLTLEGRVYLGCNIENSSFSLTQCAERTAFFKAVSEGEKNFSAIAVVGGKKGEAPSKICSPCGACRQVMAELCNASFKIILGTYEETVSYTLNELLPKSFDCL